MGDWMREKYVVYWRSAGTSIPRFRAGGKARTAEGLETEAGNVAGRSDRRAGTNVPSRIVGFGKLQKVFRTKQNRNFPCRFCVKSTTASASFTPANVPWNGGREILWR
ncbi:MAG TPA: hypothetical protein DEB39_04545 [Planctomycetaceae bacterium]|nr:hypothetical protein [Planctomycetaceae bacterium]